MGRILLLLLLAGPLTAGCARKANLRTETDADRPPPKDEVQSSEAQKGPTAEAIQELLLKLRRVNFSLDSIQLHPEIQAFLTEAAEQLKRYPEVQLFIEGHADDRGTTEYNMALSDRRARVVVDFLSRYGIPRDRLFVVPKGEEYPLDKGSGATAWAKNRCVEFRLKQGNIRFELKDGILLDDSGAPLLSLARTDGS